MDHGNMAQLNLLHSLNTADKQSEVHFQTNRAKKVIKSYQVNPKKKVSDR